MITTRKLLMSVGSVFAAMTLSAGTAFAGCATDGMPGSMDRPGGFPERALGMIVPYGPAGGSGQVAQAMAQAAGIWDASNHRTLAALQGYAKGRTRLNSAYGPDLHLVDMDLYTQFVAHQLVSNLLRDEHSRLVATPQP